jgi:hypothetical protein
MRDAANPDKGDIGDQIEDVRMSDVSAASSSKKRGRDKLPESELSTHPESVKRRRRFANLDRDKKTVDLAKNADRAARRYARQKLHKTLAYVSASAEDQKTMVLEVEAEVMRKRYVKHFRS